jgi:hypothetical protein
LKKKRKENAALLRAMKKGRKTALLNQKEQVAFLTRLKKAQ